jgi:hypothetical protein
LTASGYVFRQSLNTTAPVLWENFGILQRTGQGKGNVLLDFLIGGRLQDVHLTIQVTTGNFQESLNSYGSHFDDVGFNERGVSTLWFNPNHAVEFTAQGKQTSGKHSPATIMMHELTHAWMRNINPILAETAANKFIDNGASILERKAIEVENQVGQIRGESSGRYYHQGSSIRGYKSSRVLSTDK